MKKLTPTIDYLFDQGFITFEDNKKIAQLISKYKLTIKDKN
jgi:hypothetical protein